MHDDTYLCSICNRLTTGPCTDPDCLAILDLHRAWAQRCNNRVLRRAIDVGAALKREIVREERECML